MRTSEVCILLQAACSASSRVWQQNHITCLLPHTPRVAHKTSPGASLLATPGKTRSLSNKKKIIFLSFKRIHRTVYPENVRNILKQWTFDQLILKGQEVCNNLPNATVQQSLLFSPWTGSILATGSSFCLGSHTFTVPVMDKSKMAKSNRAWPHFISVFSSYCWLCAWQ